MNILLLKPKWFDNSGCYRFAEILSGCNLGLGIIASLSEGHNVKIVDGDYQEIPFKENFDLIGITVTTFTSQKVFEYIKKFKTYNPNVKIVLGGVHPTLKPEECLKFADSIVKGEAENVWKNVLEDVENQRLKKVYSSDYPADLDKSPEEDRNKMYESDIAAFYQISRGCNLKCKFCYLPESDFNLFRKKSVKRVIDDLRKIPQKLIIFVDDNLFTDREYCKLLFKEMIELKKIWVIQAPTTIYEDKELVKLMVRAGCYQIMCGFQSVNENSLEKNGVYHNKVSKFKKIIKIFHRFGLLVQGFFIFGFDTDKKDIFQNTVNFIKDSGLDDAYLYILTPYPGTRFYEELKKDGRLDETRSRDNYGWGNSVFKPKNMTSEELEKGVQWAYNQLVPYFNNRLKGWLESGDPFLKRNPELLKVFDDGMKKRVVLK